MYKHLLHYSGLCIRSYLICVFVNMPGASMGGPGGWSEAQYDRGGAGAVRSQQTGGAH